MAGKTTKKAAAKKKIAKPFLGIHCFTNYVKVAFFRGASLRPVPPGESKDKYTRYLDIREDGPLDEELVASWIRQASELPGWVP